MHKFILTIVLICAISSFGSLAFSQKDSPLKKTIALDEFENVTAGQTNSTGGGGSQGSDSSTQSTDTQSNQPNDPNAQAPDSHPDYSNALMTNLIAELEKTNAFIVTEGQDPTQQVQMLISGSINKWETTPKGDGNPLHSYHSHYMTTIGIALKIVNGSTGQTISMSPITQTVREKNLFNNKADFTLDSALHLVAIQCVGFIKTASVKILWQGKILKMDADGTIFIEPGSVGGVAPGMVFNVYKLGEQLTDQNGQSLGYDLKKVGSLKVTGDTGDGKAAKATVINDNGIKADDIIKTE